MNGCGITQAQLSAGYTGKRLRPPRGVRIAPRIRGMHSAMHDLARMVSEWCQEPEQFALYLGKVKFMGESASWSLWSELKQSRTPIRNRAALFMALTSKEEIKKRKN